ncbi:MAG TPA: hypothetical protein VHB79_04615 [Polyangiaceae bacterium]|nr:hypothetical protein [Polyangiaceae bacterium]
MNGEALLESPPPNTKPPTARGDRRFWGVVSASFALGALFHGYASIVGDSSPPWRHALFVAINLGAAWGCWRKPPWFIWPFALLLLQQLYSHGRDFVRAWPEHLDTRSLAVLVWMPVVAIALWRQRRAAG